MGTHLRGTGLEGEADIGIPAVLALLGDDGHAQLVAARAAHLAEGDLAAADGHVAQHHVLVEELRGAS